MSGAERLEQVREALHVADDQLERASVAAGGYPGTLGSRSLARKAHAALAPCIVLTEEEADFLLEFGKWPTETAAKAALALLDPEAVS